MSVKIWCNCATVKELKKGWALYPDPNCSSCKGSGYIEKGCENCGKNNSCYKIVLMEVNEKITFCTAWEAKQ